MSDIDQPPPARHRRTRERGQGQRVNRVNLRLSDTEHGTLETAATGHRQTLAGYVSAAALAAARDELPPDAREAMVRLFGMEAHLMHLREALGGEHDELPGDVAATLYAMREALEETVDEFINLSRRARGKRALPRPPVVPAAKAAVPQQPAAAVAPATSAPGTARDWVTQLDKLTRQLEDRGTTLAVQHWHHHHVYDALVRAVAALGKPIQEALMS